MFHYTAFGPGGERLTGMMDATGEAEVIATLQRQGSLPVKAQPADRRRDFAGAWTINPTFRRGISKRDTAYLFRELATMLTAGQDLDRALRFMEATASGGIGGGSVCNIVTSLRDAVRGGSALSDAMARHAEMFPPMHIGLVRAGEASGDLGATLTRIADLLDRQQVLSSTIVSAMIYPAVLAVAMTGATTLLLTQVLPQFLPLFEQNGVTLPASTQFLVAAGGFVQDDGLMILLGLLLAGLIAHAALRQERIRLVVDTLLMRLPLTGGLMREVMAARLTRVLGTLLQNGVALIPALAIVRDSIGNRAARHAVGQASITARGGGGLTPDLEASRLFPVRMIHLLRLGEETGQLAIMALRAADIHEDKVRTATQRLTALLVPAMTILMGITTGGIVTSLMTAMLSLNSLAGG
ncbi:MAG TPA: type II secretion system F family protein [Rhodopila sp.]|uniref:type II secretion system F family protein n=1 Tax=Rhodopila sp. TaxID=2480087 RepID=UPI002B758ABD|nr:type II secretion system F family protein [Rhodopila sp.]HVY15977.1 type II secretion system F family protein [Rhodopila sp.]